MAYNSAVGASETLCYRQIYQSSRFKGLRIFRIILEVRNQCHDAMERLVLTGPAPMPRLKVAALGEAEESVDVFAAVDYDAGIYQ